MPKPPDRISNEKRYAFVTRMLEYLNEKIIQAFSLFIKLFSAVVGGIIWLSIQENKGSVLAKLNAVVPLLLPVIATVALVQIWVNWYAWYGFRKAETNLVGPEKVPAPIFPRSAVNEIIMSSVIIVATIAGIVVLKF